MEEGGDVGRLMQGGEGASQNRMAGKRFPQFVYNLFRIVSCEDSSIIRWDQGRIVLLDVDRLVSEILPKYFRHSRYASFVRQLNYFGFRKLKGTTRTGPTIYINKTVEGKRPEALLMLERKKSVKNDMASLHGGMPMETAMQGGQMNSIMGYSKMLAQAGMGGTGGMYNDIRAPSGMQHMMQYPQSSMAPMRYDRDAYTREAMKDQYQYSGSMRDMYGGPKGRDKYPPPRDAYSPRDAYARDPYNSWDQYGGLPGPVYPGPGQAPPGDMDAYSPYAGYYRGSPYSNPHTGSMANQHPGGHPSPHFSAQGMPSSYNLGRMTPADHLGSLYPPRGANSQMYDPTGGAGSDLGDAVGATGGTTSPIRVHGPMQGYPHGSMPGAGQQMYDPSEVGRHGGHLHSPGPLQPQGFIPGSLQDRDPGQGMGGQEERDVQKQRMALMQQGQGAGPEDNGAQKNGMGDGEGKGQGQGAELRGQSGGNGNARMAPYQPSGAMGAACMAPSMESMGNGMGMSNLLGAMTGKGHKGTLYKNAPFETAQAEMVGGREEEGQLQQQASDLPVGQVQAARPTPS